MVRLRSWSRVARGWPAVFLSVVQSSLLTGSGSAFVLVVVKTLWRTSRGSVSNADIDKGPAAISYMVIGLQTFCKPVNMFGTPPVDNIAS